MKKMILTIACVFSFVAIIKADNYQPITRNQLPQKAQTFLSTHFADAKTSLLRRELDVTELNYDVIFTDGSKVEFDRKGNWTEIDCLTHPLPLGIVPKAIEKVIHTHTWKKLWKRNRQNLERLPSTVLQLMGWNLNWLKTH